MDMVLRNKNVEVNYVEENGDNLEILDEPVDIFSTDGENEDVTPVNVNRRKQLKKILNKARLQIIKTKCVIVNENHKICHILKSSNSLFLFNIDKWYQT